MNIDYKQLEFIDAKLRDLMSFLEDRAAMVLTITSLYRIGDTGVHGQLPLRGVDIRVRDKDIGEMLESIVNIYWQYDPERPQKECAILHGDGWNMHLHLQVHPNTLRIN
jgi:hypothetical protein